MKTGVAVEVEETVQKRRGGRVEVEEDRRRRWRKRRKRLHKIYLESGIQ